jgi:hypothetical protein
MLVIVVVGKVTLQSVREMREVSMKAAGRRRPCLKKGVVHRETESCK